MTCWVKALSLEWDSLRILLFTDDKARKSPNQNSGSEFSFVIYTLVYSKPKSELIPPKYRPGNKNQNVSKCFTCFALLAILGTESSSKYEIKNPLGQRVYFAVEENGCFDRKLCSPLRAFTIRIADNAGREVIRVIRPLRCNSCCFPCFLQELEVQSPPGTIAGYVVQNWDPFLPKFTIQNQSKEDVLKIIGPCATCGCFEDVDFEVKALNEMTTIGKISKYWSGFVNNVFTNTANFGIQVPVDLDVRIKAVMIGACFLIDLMFFENSLDGL
uniref:Phospholipid scramblase n=1 Tax=Zosterops lateralis melanops TaxID=1220523 RepID=A0A8D2P6J6_ZOSLA